MCISVMISCVVEITTYYGYFIQRGPRNFRRSSANIHSPEVATSWNLSDCYHGPRTTYHSYQRILSSEGKKKNVRYFSSETKRISVSKTAIRCQCSSLTQRSTTPRRIISIRSFLVLCCRCTTSSPTTSRDPSHGHNSGDRRHTRHASDLHRPGDGHPPARPAPLVRRAHPDRRRVYHQ